MKPILKIYLTNSCTGCDEAFRIVDQMKEKHADLLTVEVIDMMDKQAIVPEAVFATPTYTLNDRIVSLGNPSPEQVNSWLEEAIDLVAVAQMES